MRYTTNESCCILSQRQLNEMSGREEEFAYGLSFGPDAEEDQNLFAYDQEFEQNLAEKALEMRKVDRPPKSAGKRSPPCLIFGIEDEEDIPQKSYAYDVEFETTLAAKAIRNGGKGSFLRRDWLFVNGSEVCLNERRPLLLYTQAHDATPGTECSKAHDQHPFVALVHLLKHADVGSTVFISMPYFTDMHAMDELCHFAQDVESGGRGLVINVIVSQTGDNKAKLNEFIGGDATVQEAVERLGLRSTKVFPGFCHSKAVYSTAGVMTGSYNFTSAARLYNEEHGLFLGPGHEDNNQLRLQLEARWNRATPMIRAKVAQTGTSGTKRSNSSISK